MKDDIVEKLLSYLKTTEDFILDQMPSTIQQALKYEKISAFLVVILMLILISGGLFALNYFWTHPEFDKYQTRSTSSAVGMIAPAIVIPICFLQTCYSIDKLLKLYIAPKYYLISLLINLKE